MSKSNGDFANILNLLGAIGLSQGAPPSGPCPCGCDSAPLHEQALNDSMDAAVGALNQAREQAHAALSRFLEACERHEQTLAYYETVRTNKDLSKFFGDDLRDAAHILADVRGYIESRGMVLPLKTMQVEQEGCCEPAPVVAAKPAAAAAPAAKPAVTVKKVTPAPASKGKK